MGRPARERIDVLLVDRGLAPNRSKAQAWVLAGDVTCANKHLVDVGQRVEVSLRIQLTPQRAHAQVGDA